MFDELVKRAKSGDDKALGEIVERLQPLLVSSIRRYYNKAGEYEDLMQDGNIKIIESINNFDEDKGVHFLGYIKLNIKYLYLDKHKQRFHQSIKGRFVVKKILMAKIADKILQTNLMIKKGESLLIVTEPEKMSIAETIAASAVRMDVEPVISIMMPRETDSQEPPQIIAEAMKASDAFLSVVGKSITHTDAIKEALANGSRGLVLTQFSEDMMIEGGMEADFERLAPLCQDMAKALEGGNHIRLTTPYGTDLTFSATGRRGNALYCIVDKGEFSTAPTIEANVSPIEGTARGKIVADASIPYIGIGLLKEPVYFEVEDGNIVSIEGGYQADMLRQDLASKNDPGVYNIAELGIGLNLGGTLKAASHYDLIMTKPTVAVDGRTVLRDGEVVLHEALGTVPSASCKQIKLTVGKMVNIMVDLQMKSINIQD